MYLYDILSKYKKIIKNVLYYIMIINCPHCDQMIEILELRCRVFRCGIYKKTGEQINPHASKETCDEIKRCDLIYGCGKPFFINMIDKVEKCSYI